MPKANNPPEYTVDTTNEYALHASENMANHSASLAGRGKFITVGVPTYPLFRTKQSAYRFAGYLLSMAEVLADEDGEHSFEQVLEAIQTPKNQQKEG